MTEGLPPAFAGATATRPRAAHPGKRPTIVLDPGHGGIDPGAIGRTGVEEKHIVLAIAKDLAAECARSTGATVHLTRSGDSFMSLEDRIAMAESAKADLFVSIHADSCPDPDARGLSTYTLSEHGSDRMSEALARGQNNVDHIFGVNLKKMDKTTASILLDLAKRDTLGRSLALQNRLVSDLSGRTRLLENPARSANFVVLRSTSVPALLVETGFLSNGQDEALLRTVQYRHELARILARSLTDSLQKTAQL